MVEASTAGRSSIHEVADQSSIVRKVERVGGRLPMPVADGIDSKTSADFAIFAGVDDRSTC